jgi:hypothetical protein
MQPDPLAIWRHDLDPKPILNYPLRRPGSTLMGVEHRLGAVQNFLGTLDANHPDEGVMIATLAVAFTFSVLGFLGLEDNDGPTPPITNLGMARLAIANLRATVRSHLEAWQRAAYQDDDEPEATVPARDEAETAAPTIEVARWADLGIGIGVGKYYAFSPCPETGERVKLKDATILALVGDRWSKVLGCLARSHDGNTAGRNDLVMKLHPFKCGAISEEQAVFDEGMQEKAKNALTTLRHTMADLGRELRGFVTTADHATVFKINSDDYLAAFTARHLLRDEDGNYSFGEAR